MVFSELCYIEFSFVEWLLIGMGFFIFYLGCFMIYLIFDFIKGFNELWYLLLLLCVWIFVDICDFYFVDVLKNMGILLFIIFY